MGIPDICCTSAVSSRVDKGVDEEDLNIFRLHVPSMYKIATMKKLKNLAKILNKFLNFFNILYL